VARRRQYKLPGGSLSQSNKNKGEIRTLNTTLPSCSVLFHSTPTTSERGPSGRPAAEVRGAASKPQAQASFPPQKGDPPFPSSSVSQRHFPRRYCVLRQEFAADCSPNPFHRFNRPSRSLGNVVTAAASGEGSHGTRPRRP
jgi:hypothetical protein